MPKPTISLDRTKLLGFGGARLLAAAGSVRSGASMVGLKNPSPAPAPAPPPLLP